MIVGSWQVEHCSHLIGGTPPPTTAMTAPVVLSPQWLHSYDHQPVASVPGLVTELCPKPIFPALCRTERSIRGAGLTGQWMRKLPISFARATVRADGHANSLQCSRGGVAEWFKAAVLKTAVP